MDAKKQWASYVEEYDKNAEMASQKLVKLKAEKAALNEELTAVRGQMEKGSAESKA